MGANLLYLNVMGAPRFVSITIKVDGANAAIDVTGDLITFSIEDVVKNGKADNLDIVLDDASKRYRNTWFIEKGTKIQAALTTHNWNAPGDSQTRDFGPMWVDTVEMNIARQGNTITIKATGAPPTLAKGSAASAGTEGQSAADQSDKDAKDAGLSTDNNPPPIKDVNPTPWTNDFGKWMHDSNANYDTTHPPAK